MLPNKVCELNPNQMTDSELKKALNQTKNLKSDYSKALVRQAELRWGNTNA